YLIFLCLPWVCWCCPAAAIAYTPVAPALPAALDPSPQAANELQALDRLIDATQKNLEKQRALRVAIADYLKLQDLYLKNDQDKELMFRMVKNAHRILESIKENHLVHLFNADFISELTLFSQIAVKKGIPKP